MENAVDALKIAFAILVFIIAIALTFSVITKIRQTSDVLYEARDSNKYYIDELDNITYMTAKEETNRSVGAETIIQTIYRYYKENFGVTIFNIDLNPIARYDLDTENIMNNWNSNSEATNKAHIDYLNKYINPTLLDNSKENDNNKKWESLEDIKNEINGYKTLATPWIGSEDRIIERIKADIYGKNVKFNSNTYVGKNLSSYFSGKFTEYFVFIPILKEDGTKDYDKTDKLEIIYVQE